MPQDWWDTPFFSPMDRRLTRLHARVFRARPRSAVAAALALHVLLVLAFGFQLKISSNYSVILPVLAAGLAFGLPGGLAAGALGLPLNMALFFCLGHLDYAPASPLIAEIAGLVVGASFGFLSDYLRKVEREIERRRDAEELKDVLLRELQHRVKNNLNVIKGLIQLQRNRSKDPAFRDASQLLLDRIYAIAHAHDSLFSGQSAPASESASLEAVAYLQAVASNVVASYLEAEVVLSVRAEPPDLRLPAETARNLGLALNELATNAVKHAFPGNPSPRLEIFLDGRGAAWTLTVRDNGPGAGDGVGPGLGLSILDAVVARMGGSLGWVDEAGLVFEMSFPKPRG